LPCCCRCCWQFTLPFYALLLFSFIIIIPVGCVVANGSCCLAANASCTKDEASSLPHSRERGEGRLVFSLLSPFCLAWISIMLFIVVLSLSFPFAIAPAVVVVIVVVNVVAGFQLMLFPATCISFLLWLCK